MDLRAELERALAVDDATERKIVVVAVVSAALEGFGVRPVIVGGVAVEYWTYGAYATDDIDVLMPYLPAIDARLAEIGFERQGRHWVIPGSDLFLEAPGNTLGEGEEAVEVQVSPDRAALVLSAEDILITRLEEFLATGHRDPAEQSVLLLGSQRLDDKRLRLRVRQKRIEPVLAAVERLAKRRERGEEIASFELHDLARQLQAELW